VGLKRPFGLAFTFLAVVVPSAGCGGGGRNDGAKVAVSLRDYFSALHPEDSVFPTGAGPPHVKDNGCKDMHRKPPLLPLGPIQVPPPSSTKSKNANKAVLWQCSVRFRNFTLPVLVAVNDSSQVAWAWPVNRGSGKPPKLAPARTYTG
jgi:hypothetical protein